MSVALIPARGVIRTSTVVTSGSSDQLEPHLRGVAGPEIMSVEGHSLLLFELALF